jgi:hypothetical protein
LWALKVKNFTRWENPTRKSRDRKEVVLTARDSVA